jgi:hypothetical protein
MSKRIALVLLILAGFVGSVRAQSLAEVAKKEEERRKALPPPTKIYTNKDLKDVPAGTPPSAEASKEADQDKAADKDAKDKDTKDADKAKDVPVKDQAYWSKRLKDLQGQLERDQAFADALQTKVNSLNTDFVNRDDPAQRAVIERDRQKALAEIARLQKAVLDGKKAIADLEEEARRAGVPPGWLR